MATVGLWWSILSGVAAACGGSEAPPPSAPAAAPSSTPPAPAPPPSSSRTESCPQLLLQDGQRHGGACLDPEVIGEATASRCGAYLIANGWRPDAEAEAAIRSRTQQPLHCYRAPR